MGGSASRATQTIDKQFTNKITNAASQSCTNIIEGDIIGEASNTNINQTCALSMEASFQVLVDAITETLAENTADALAGFGIAATDSDQVIRDKIKTVINNTCNQSSENILKGDIIIKRGADYFSFNQSGNLNMDCAAAIVTKAIAKTQAANTSKATGASLASFLGGRNGLTGLVMGVIIIGAAFGILKMSGGQRTNRKPKSFYIFKLLLILIIVACFAFYIWYIFTDLEGEDGSDIKEKNPFAWELKMWIPAFAIILSIILLYLLPVLISDVDDVDDESDLGDYETIAPYSRRKTVLQEPIDYNLGRDGDFSQLDTVDEDDIYTKKDRYYDSRTRYPY